MTQKFFKTLKVILISTILLFNLIDLYSQARKIFDIHLTLLEDISADNSNAIIRLFFKAEKCFLISASKLKDKENKQYRISSSTGRGGYYLIKPLADLNTKNIFIYESGFNKEEYKKVSVYESNLKIVNSPKNFKIYSILLLDISGSISKKIEDNSFNPPVLDKLKEASVKFVDNVNVGNDKLLAVYAFDGRKNIIPVVDFSNNVKEIKEKIQSLDKSLIEDYSTNLYGAIIKAIEKLQERINSEDESVYIKVGTVTVFTDGTDQAGRLGSNGNLIVLDKIDEVKKEMNFYFYSIGLGREIDKKILKSFGRDGFNFVPYASSISA
ncbi:MAG: VWA domain-containing protein, partial [Spirochaetes bacterium]|nr:VWA domain-containing protein [Spirochaetota bacterium]